MTTTDTGATTWNGSWVAGELDLALVTDHGEGGRTLQDLVGLAVRRNPKRAHLLVSSVLGKHVPTDPHEVLAASALLGATLAALLGGVPLMLGNGTGAELRQPLGYTIVGGLMLSQILTLYTTPVVYLYLDRVQRWLSPSRRRTMPTLADKLGADEIGATAD